MFLYFVSNILGIFFLKICFFKIWDRLPYLFRNVISLGINIQGVSELIGQTARESTYKEAILV